MPEDQYTPDAEKSLEQRPETPIIESASGTTDPENANSGIAAYVIFGAAVALLAVLCLGITSCVSTLGTIAATHSDSYGFGGFGDSYGNEDLFDHHEDSLVPEDDFFSELDGWDTTEDEWFARGLGTGSTSCERGRA